MDRGGFIRNGYGIEVTDGGSFVATQGGPGWNWNRDEGRNFMRSMRGFSSYADLLAWLKDEHEALHGKAHGAKLPPGDDKGRVTTTKTIGPLEEA